MRSSVEWLVRTMLEYCARCVFTACASVNVQALIWRLERRSYISTPTSEMWRHVDRTGGIPRSARWAAERESDLSLSFLVILAAGQVPTNDAWRAAVQ